MSQYDYELVLDVNRAYAVNGSEEPLDNLFTFLKQEDFEQIYDDADISEEHRDLGYGVVREFDMSTESGSQDAVDFLTDRTNNFEEDVLVRIRNADEAPDDLREDLEHAIKSFHETHSFDTHSPNTCVLVSGADSLTRHDFTLSGRIFSPPELR